MSDRIELNQIHLVSHSISYSVGVAETLFAYVRKLGSWSVTSVLFMWSFIKCVVDADTELSQSSSDILRLRKRFVRHRDEESRLFFARRQTRLNQQREVWQGLSTLLKCRSNYYYIVSEFIMTSLSRVTALSSAVCWCRRPSLASLFSEQYSTMWFIVYGGPHEHLSGDVTKQSIMALTNDFLSMVFDLLSHDASIQIACKLGSKSCTFCVTKRYYG